MSRIVTDFDTTLAGLEQGLQVRHVAEFSLKTCRPDQLVDDVLSDWSLVGFDQIPVHDGEAIIGVLERPLEGHPQHQVTAGPWVEDAMRRLESTMLVAESQPVGDLLGSLMPSRYRLVVRGAGLEGIVTASDFLKLPVRLYAFMLITHLEMAMAAAIRDRFSDAGAEAWMSYLSNNRRAKVLDEVRKHSRAKLDPDPVEFTQFCDKRTIFWESMSMEDTFEDDLKAI